MQEEKPKEAVSWMDFLKERPGPALRPGPATVMSAPTTPRYEEVPANHSASSNSDAAGALSWQEALQVFASMPRPNPPSAAGLSWVDFLQATKDTPRGVAPAAAAAPPDDNSSSSKLTGSRRLSV